MRGRKRRLKHFEERAKNFVNDLVKGKGSGHRVTRRDGRPVIISTGKHRRLIFKGYPEKTFSGVGAARQLESRIQQQHLRRGIEFQDGLMKGLEKKRIRAEHYCLVPARTEFVKTAEEEGLRIQECFNKPSVSLLLSFLKVRAGNRKMFDGTTEERQLCKQFANQHRGITLEKLLQAVRELNGHAMSIFGEITLHSNIIVLGQKRDGKIRLTIIDY